jgi:twinkle protein
MAGIDEFVIATDNDEAGVALRDELVRRLGAEKCRIVEYPSQLVVKNSTGEMRQCKDMNEVLIHFGADMIKQIINNSQSIPVDGIYYLDNVFPQMIEKFRKGITLGDTTRFGDFDDYFRWKKGDINIFTGYANAGKTTFLLQLMLTKSIYDGWRWAIFSPENYPANDFYEDIVEMYVGKWISKMTEEEYIEACLFIDLHFFYVYPEWDHDLVSISEKFRYLIMKKGVDGVMIDPFNQLDKNQKAYERDDQYISNTLKDIKRFALLNGVCYNIIMHPKSPQYNQDKSLPVVDMYDIAGGAMTGNKSDQIASYYKPNFHIDKNDGNVEIHIQKVKRKRTGGKLGVFNLYFDWETKRYKDSFGNIFCDPERAKRVLFKEANGILPDNKIINAEMPF